MTNIYLEKIAAQQEDTKKRSNTKDLAAVGAGAHLLTKVPQRLLGYHKVYHGTTSENAKSIREKGFDPAKGGTGASTISENYKSRSQGKIHVTKTKLAARLYSGKLEEKFYERDEHGNRPSLKKALFRATRDSYNGKGSIIKARIPHSQWSRMKVDKDSSGNAPENAFVQERMKERAATSTRKIDKRFVQGKGTGGIKQFATKNNLRRYLGTRSGKIRALGGVGQLAAGSALIGNAVHNRFKSHDK